MKMQHCHLNSTSGRARGKGLALAEGEDLLKGRPIGEDGKRVANQMVLSDTSGLKGGWYGGGPMDFLEKQEQRDYHDAPDEPENRTSAQNDAVYLYNRARKYIRAENGGYWDILAKIEKKREKRAQGLYEEEGMHPLHFLTSKEQNDYHNAPDEPENRTAAQDNAVYLYQRARKYIRSRIYSHQEIRAKMQEKREKRAIQELDEADMAPFDFLKDEEQRDYHDAPNLADDRTYKQDTAVYLYNRARKYIDKGDYSYQEIHAKIERKREKRAMQELYEVNMAPFDFLKDEEQRNYHDAPNLADDRTYKQDTAVYLYNRARKYIDKGDYSYQEIHAKIERKREKRAMQELYEFDLERGMSPFHFMTEQEQRDYHDAPSFARDRTDEQENIVRLYERIEGDIKGGYGKEYVEEQAEAHRRAIYGEAGPSHPVEISSDEGERRPLLGSLRDEAGPSNEADAALDARTQQIYALVDKLAECHGFGGKRSYEKDDIRTILNNNKMDEYELKKAKIYLYRNYHGRERRLKTYVSTALSRHYSM